MHIRSIELSNSSVGVSERAAGCLPLCEPAMNWCLLQGVTQPSPGDSWEGLQLTHVTLDSRTISGYRRWMDVYMYMYFLKK